MILVVVVVGLVGLVLCSWRGPGPRLGQDQLCCAAASETQRLRAAWCSLSDWDLCGLLIVKLCPPPRLHAANIAILLGVLRPHITSVPVLRRTGPGDAVWRVKPSPRLYIDSRGGDPTPSSLPPHLPPHSPAVRLLQSLKSRQGCET